MSVKVMTAVGIIALALTGCASTSPEEEAAAAARVRIVGDADAVRGCEPYAPSAMMRFNGSR